MRRWDNVLAYLLPIGFMAILFLPVFFAPHDSGLLLRWAFVGPLAGLYLGLSLPRRNSN